MPAIRHKAGEVRSATVFAALGDETRLRLVVRLGTDGPISITSLTSDSKISRQAISKHLNVLARAGLVRGVRKGRERIYELDPREIRKAQECLDGIAEQWDRALSKLKILVEGR